MEKQLISSNIQEESAMLDINIDDLEVESFVTGLNDYERESIKNGYNLSCTYTPSTPGGSVTVCC